MAAYLLDTNVLLHAADPGTTTHAIACSAIQTLVVRMALEKEQWKITDDPLRLEVGDRDRFTAPTHFFVHPSGSPLFAFLIDAIAISGFKTLKNITRADSASNCSFVGQGRAPRGETPTRPLPPPLLTRPHPPTHC
jgi:hypothetical protein